MTSNVLLLKSAGGGGWWVGREMGGGVVGVEVGRGLDTGTQIGYNLIHKLQLNYVMHVRLHTRSLYIISSLSGGGEQ